MALTNFPNGLSSFGIPVLGGASIPFTGTYYFVDAVNGSDGNRGTSPSSAFSSVYKAHASMTAGKNDVCYVIGDGSTAATQRLSLANAQLVDSSATSGTLVWSKRACHLIGITSPTQIGQRARFAPPTGTYTQTTFGSANFVTVSPAVDGCYFANFSLFHAFSTGGTDQVCWTDSGSRNVYENVNFGGIADAVSAADAGARSFVVNKSGTNNSGEHTFIRCTFGIDTVTRSAANASLGFTGQVPRCVFRDCIFPFHTSAATVLGIIAAASSLDRFQDFNNCVFVNAIKSSSTAMTGLATIPASVNGLMSFRNSTLVGIGEWGTDATSRGLIYVDGGTVTAATSGIAVNPT